MIQVQHLSKKFGKITAVDDVNLRAERGEIYGLLGPNGAGKTSTLRMIYGVFQPSSGSISIDNIDVIKTPLNAQRRLGVLPDGGSLYKRLTARENIKYFGELHGMSSGEIDVAIEKLSNTLGMDSILHRRTAGFSQGERMKVNLARALVHDPDYILLDEPTNGLDVVTTRAVRHLLLDLKSQGKCIIFSSHLMHEVSNLCDKVGIIAHGKMIAQGDIQSIRSQANAETLEDAFIHFAYGDAEVHKEVS